MHANGLLPDAGLIFYLTHEEIATVLSDRSRGDLINKAMRRRRLVPELKKLKFDEFQFGVIKPRDIDAESVAMKNLVKVIGTPVCEGTAFSMRFLLRFLLLVINTCASFFF